MFRNNQKKKMIHKKGNVSFLSGFSKRDKEKVKNMIKEQLKIRDMINTNLKYRNDFLRSQRIMDSIRFSGKKKKYPSTASHVGARHV